MNSILSEGNILRTDKKILGLVGLVALALICAGPTRAQSKPAQTFGAPATSAETVRGIPPSIQSPGTGPSGAALPAEGATQKTTQSPAQNSSTKLPAPKGQSEGINVHGHWVIEVKNPDGKVVTHREFENAIQQTGMLYLPALMAGNYSAGGLSILLNGADATFNSSNLFFLGFSNSDTGPCLPLSVPAGPFGGTTSIGGPSSGTTCLISSGTTSLGFLCLFNQTTNATNELPSPCSANLSSIADGSSTPNLVLGGSVNVSSSNPGNITDVETVFAACAPTATPTNCVDAFNPQTLAPTTNGANPVALGLFTQKTLGLPGGPPTVGYMPGQSISVTVTISFQ